LRPAVGRR
jgi:hypothetical protein